MNPTVSAAWRARTRAALAGLVASLVLIAAALILAPASASAAAPPGFVGLQSWQTPTTTNMKGMKNAKVKTFRMQLAWSSVEPNRPTGGRCDTGDGCKHDYRWGRYDKLFAQMARRGIRVTPVLLGSPSWAASKPQNPPLKNGSVERAFYTFAARAAYRYGPQSKFWTRRRLDGSTVGAKYWQVWNEPNLKNYWNNEPNPRQYASFLKRTSMAIERRPEVGRATGIYTAGMPWASSGNPSPPDFIRGMFKANPTIYKHFTAVAIHPYDPTPSGVIAGVRQVRSTLNGISRGARAKRMYLSEFGWATGSPDRRFQVSEADQAKYLKQTYDELLRLKDSYKIDGAAWFNLQDVRGADWWAERTGLLRSDGKPKPSWARLKCVTGAQGCR